MSDNHFTQFKLQFLIKQVFRPNNANEESYIDSAIDMAYLDVNRTIHGYSKAHNAILHLGLRAILKEAVGDFRINFYDLHTFNVKHDTYCNNLIDTFNTELPTNKPTLCYGQAQKWLNMTLKYLLTLTLVCPSLDDLEINYKHFHVPIDKYILKDLGVPLSDGWSRINRNVYLEYQSMFRTKYYDQIPIVKEFQVWNEYRSVQS